MMRQHGHEQLVFDLTMSDPELAELIANEPGGRKRAESYLSGMRATPYGAVLRNSMYLMSKLWRKLAMNINVDDENLDAVMEAAERGTLVLVPTHKTHLDYMVGSCLVYHFTHPLGVPGLST